MSPSVSAIAPSDSARRGEVAGLGRALALDSDASDPSAIRSERDPPDEPSLMRVSRSGIVSSGLPMLAAASRAAASSSSALASSCPLAASLARSKVSIASSKRPSWDWAQAGLPGHASPFRGIRREVHRSL